MSRYTVPLVAIVAMVTVAVVLFQTFQRQASAAFFTFSLHPEALELLESSLEDQRRLAELDEESSEEYRARFDRVQTLLQRMLVLQHSRDEILRRYQLALLSIFLGTLALAAGFMLWRQRLDERRLEHLGAALAALAAGRTDLELGETRRDVIGRIARMVERTSRRMERDRRRLRSLENLSAWQEAARRHAHEMKTPLTAARLELERVESLAAADDPERLDELRRSTQGVRQEIDRLNRFTQAFTSFARLPSPSPVPLDLRAFVEEFTSVFDGAWPTLRLQPEVPEDLPPIDGDRDMLRQVLVNLCDNAAQAGAATMRFGAALVDDRIRLEAGDDGPGVDPSLQERLFEPYTTTKRIGEGMGLGLAICRKILLDHGGDLELVELASATSPTSATAAKAASGAVFRLTLRRTRPSLDAVDETRPSADPRSAL